MEQEGRIEMPYNWTFVPANVWATNWKVGTWERCVFDDLWVEMAPRERHMKCVMDGDKSDWQYKWMVVLLVFKVFSTQRWACSSRISSSILNVNCWNDRLKNAFSSSRVRLISTLPAIMPSPSEYARWSHVCARPGLQPTKSTNSFWHQICSVLEDDCTHFRSRLIKPHLHYLWWKQQTKLLNIEYDPTCPSSRFQPAPSPRPPRHSSGKTLHWFPEKHSCSYGNWFVCNENEANEMLS